MEDDSKGKQFAIFPGIKDNEVSNLTFYDPVTQQNAIDPEDINRIKTDSVATFFKIDTNKL